MIILAGFNIPYLYAKTDIISAENVRGLIKRLTLPVEKDKKILVLFPNRQWPNAAGIILELERKGYSPKVIPKWGFMFDPERTVNNINAKTSMQYVLNVSDDNCKNDPPLLKSKACLRNYVSECAMAFSQVRNKPECAGDVNFTVR